MYRSINVFDYDYLTIEFDVSVVEGKSPFSCMIYMLGRPNNSVKQYKSSNVWFNCDEGLIYAVNSDNSHMINPTDKIHVKYLIKVNHESNTANLQVFFNDVLYYDSIDTFTSSYNLISELRIKNFSGEGSLSISDLKTIGYNN